MKYTVTIPDFDYSFSPNKSKGRWWRYGDNLKDEHYGIMETAIIKQGRPKRILKPPVHLTIYFHPKDKRKRDLDNCLASQKYYIDATIGEIIEGDSADELSMSIFYDSNTENREIIFEFEEVKK